MNPTIKPMDARHNVTIIVLKRASIVAYRNVPTHSNAST